MDPERALKRAKAWEAAAFAIEQLQAAKAWWDEHAAQDHVVKTAELSWDMPKGSSKSQIALMDAMSRVVRRDFHEIVQETLALLEAEAAEATKIAEGA